MDKWLLRTRHKRLSARNVWHFHTYTESEHKTRQTAKTCVHSREDELSLSRSCWTINTDLMTNTYHHYMHKHATGIPYHTSNVLRGNFHIAQVMFCMATSVLTTWPVVGSRFSTQTTIHWYPPSQTPVTMERPTQTNHELIPSTHSVEKSINC
jgi:hypothetical protein